MAIEEALDLSVELVHSHAHRLKPISPEDNAPELLQTIEGLKTFVRLISSRLSEVSAEANLLRVQHALAIHNFHQEIFWSPNQISVQECRATVEQFQRLGYTGVSYILQLRLLRAKVPLSQAELECLQHSWYSFKEDVTQYLQLHRQGPLSRLGNYRLFTPREFVRTTTVARDISAESRLDCLGRSSFQVLYDAGITVKWPPTAINHVDLLGRTALHQALSQRDKPTVFDLLNQKANIRQLSMNQLSALHIAACQGCTSIIGYLVKTLKHPVDMPDGLGRSPFWHAAENSHLSIMKLLGLRSDVDIERKDYHGLSAYATAAREGRYDVLGYLFRLRKKRRHTTKSRHSHDWDVDHQPFLLASKHKRWECVDLILERRSWKAGDFIFTNVHNLAQLHNDAKLVERLEQLWEIDGLRAHEVGCSPWPTTRGPKEPLPRTVYTSSFDTKAWNAWHLAHTQPIVKDCSVAEPGLDTVPAFSSQTAPRLQQLDMSQQSA
ncbi:hypothetical protein OPT61_g1641 [Boeremia exigua]|uniref:Uncharacterized protein n=1 Tax=Boeremia exigua TaxID=749465 RepID=A0ACC2IPD5_9PLEO|nr:hypothetical protein OPT61_g1641 [Boeremia exigua]